MKKLNTYILEKLHLNKDIQPQYNYHPKDQVELQQLIKELIKERGQDANLNDIDVIKIDNMNYLFYEAGVSEDIRNIDVSEWNVSKVREMCETFANCPNFDCDLSNWDVSNVTDMNGMFTDCKAFRGKGLDKWNVKNVRYMEDMFKGCESLPNIPSWWDETLV